MLVEKKELFMVLAKELLKAVGFALVAFGIIFVLSQQIAKMSESITSRAQVTALLGTKDQIISRLTSDLESVAGKDQKIMAAFPSPEGILELIAKLESSANQNSLQQTVQFGNLLPRSADASGLQLANLDYSIQLGGNILGFIQYLKNAESLPYFFSLKSVTINASTNQGWEDSSSFILQGTISINQE